MHCFDANQPGAPGSGSHPNGAGPTVFVERKGIVTDDGSGTVDFDGNPAAGVSSLRAELVDNSKCEARRICSVGDEFGVIRTKPEFVSRGI